VLVFEQRIPFFFEGLAGDRAWRKAVWGDGNLEKWAEIGLVFIFYKLRLRLATLCLDEFVVKLAIGATAQRVPATRARFGALRDLNVRKILLTTPADHL
jgi:hypothetical protein